MPRAFTDEAIWFALPYLVVRLLGLGLQVRVEMERRGADHAAAYRWAGASLVGLTLVLAGALVDQELRSVVWLAAIGADFAAATVAGRATTWDLDPAHLAERHGLFVIIALGESLIVAGAAVAGAELTTGLVLSVGAAIVVACLLWWTYFGWLKDSLEHRFASAPSELLGPLARDAFSFAHFPLVCGIVGFAVAVEETVAHPDDPMAAPPFPAWAGPAERLRFLLRYAVLAPSRHNAQPWAFEIDGEELRVHVDRRRALPATDPQGPEATIACGAALENLRIAAAHHGHDLEVQACQPRQGEPVAIARLVARRPPTPEEERLFHAIPLRRSASMFYPGPLSPEDLGRLTPATRGPALVRRLPRWLARPVAELVAEADAIQWSSARFRGRKAWRAGVKSRYRRPNGRRDDSGGRREYVCPGIPSNL